MDPTTIFCPNGHCPARGQTGMGNIGIHSQKEQRFICHACHKTFSARTGTVFYRLRTSWTWPDDTGHIWEARSPHLSCIHKHLKIKVPIEETA